MRSFLLFLVSVGLLVLTGHAEAGINLQCRQGCPAAITQCITTTALPREACKRRVLRRCRREGLQVCAPTTTSTTTSTTTTTTVPGLYLVCANLVGANLPGWNLSNANLMGADLSGANFTSGPLCRSWDRWRTSLSNANLTNANLSHADLTNAVLTGTNLAGADLTGANPSGALLYDVLWSASTCPDGTTSDSNGSTPESCCAHLNGTVPLACSP